MKKIFYFLAILSVGFSLTACSNSNSDGDNANVNKYEDKTYGYQAIDACNNVVTHLTNANKTISNAQLTTDQETFLRNVLSNLTKEVIIPTYTQLADDVEDLEKTLHGLTVNTITQAQLDKACSDFKKARQNWERSEAFLMGAASDFDIDPTIDSWPLDRALLSNYFKNGMSDEMLEDASILGFHALEFILFRDGQNRKVADLKSNDTYTNFEKISGAEELKYAQIICSLLKERCFQLQVAWEGETAANANRVAVVQNAGLDYTTEKGLSFSENLVKAGVSGSNSTFSTLQAAIQQVLSADEGSCVGIANEVGTTKITNPFANADIAYVESPYSYNSITDCQDNIRSIRNVWYGSTNGQPADISFSTFFNNVGQTALNNQMVGAINGAINAIGNMPSPFVKYCSIVWGKDFDDPDYWESISE